MLRSDVLSHIPHGFFGRRRPDGTTGEFDAREAENRIAAAACVLPHAPFALVKQVHSARTVTVDAPPDEPLPEADALVTATPGLVLGIVTADCAPVLLADPEAGVVGAAHAGWRGAHGGVLDSCVKAMIAAGARRESILAAIGPTIAQESYEVDETFRAGFATEDAAFFASGRSGHWQFDLPRYVAARLRRVGVFAVSLDTARDTYADNRCYFSYRRASGEGEPDNRRQISLIGLAAG